MTHTKGPWKVIILDGETWINPDRDSGEYALIARVNSDKNAPLIASAPDTLEVLEGCVHFLADLNGSSPFDDSVYGKDMAQRAKALQSRAYKAVQKVRG